MKKMRGQARQGDVLFINEMDKNISEATRERLFNIKKKQAVNFKKENRLPFAYGEVSGHAHVTRDEDAQLFISSDIMETVKHLEATTKTDVTHEEHEAFTIEEGKNAVLIQTEWKHKIQRVQD